MKYKPFYTSFFTKFILLFAIMILVVSCSNSNATTTSSTNGSGQLTFSPSTNILVTKGSIRHVKFSLENSVGVVDQVVNFSVSNAGTASIKSKTSTSESLATVTPATCTVSSGTMAQSSCLLTLYGLGDGNVTLTAQSNGYQSVSATTKVTDQVQYGTLQIVGQTGPSYTALYPELQAAPYKIYLTATLQNSSGVTTDNPLYVNLASYPNPCIAGTNCTFGYIPGVDIQQCQLSTSYPTCNIQGTLFSATNVNTTLNPVGALGVNYTAIPVNISGTTTPESGVITLGTQQTSTGNRTIFAGMNAPLFVNWTGFNGVAESLALTVQSSNSNLQFYNYTPGKATTKSSTATCTISQSQPNCGLGIIASATGTAQIKITSISIVPGSATNVIPALANSPYTIHITAPSTKGRTITFNNQSSDMVQIGITSGSALSFITPTQSTTGGSFDERLPAGAGSACGPTNPQAACPIGATCAQGGAVPNSTSPYYCFWSPLSIASGSAQLPSESQATVFISNSSGITTGTQQIQWSGNYHVDQCPNGICPTAESSIGAGPSYAAITLAEVTYQYSPVDYYDVSIINGANYALSFGPTQTSLISASNAYSCGQAGSSSAQDGGWSSTNQTNAGLPASSWSLTPSTSSIVGSIPTGDNPSSYFAVVNPGSNNYGTCNVNGSGCNSGATCGWDYTKVTQGNYAFTASSRICGMFVSWATANQIYGWNVSTTNQAPFNYSTTYSVSPTYQGVSAISVANLQLCNNNTYSAYGTQPVYQSGQNAGQPVTLAMACGGVNWNNIGVTRPSGAAVTVNTNWINQVLPTITWLKQGCPTCYTFPYDDFSSTFTCSNGTINSTDYTITIKNL